MKNQILPLLLVAASITANAQQKKDSLYTRTIEDVKLHKTGNPNNARVSTIKSQLDVMETPQAIAIVTHEVIEQQQAQQLSDVVKNINGVYITSARGASQDSFGARGYTFGNENIYKNGSRVNSGIFPEVSGLERVEVLKGSAAILYGNVAPGGIVNMVTKKPLFNFGGNIALNYGSWNNIKPTIDIYGGLTKNSAFRVNGSYENKESFRDIVQSEKHYFNPSFLYNISDKTQIIIEADYLKHHFTPDFGLGGLVLNTTTSESKLNTLLGINKFLGATWQYQTNEMLTSTITLNHEINSNWNFNTVAFFQDYTRDFYGTERIQWNLQNNGDYVWKRTLNKQLQEQKYGSLQFNLNGQFKTGKLNHKLLVGADADYLQADTYAYQLQKQDGTFADAGNNFVYGTNGNTSNGNISLSDETTWKSGEMLNSRQKDLNRIPTRRVGIYAQDLIAITDKFKVLAGLRWSYLENKTTQVTNYLTSTKAETANSYKKDMAFSPRLGLVYQFDESFTAFASYSNSFTPNTGLSIDSNGNTSPLDPSIINQYEVGIKKNLLKNTLAFNITAYQIDNSNLSQVSEININYRELTGKTRSQGVELDITGNPTPNLSINAGYSYNYMTYLDTPNTDGSFVEGERLVRTPANTANASIFYTLPQYIKGLKLGFTAFYTGDRLAGWNNLKDKNGNPKTNRMYEIGDFTTVDFTIGYQFKKFNVQGRLGNIFDVVDYNVHENHSVNPITPRNFYLTFNYKF